MSAARMAASGTPISAQIGMNIGDPHFGDLFVGERAYIGAPVRASAFRAIFNNHGSFLHTGRASDVLGFPHKINLEQRVASRALDIVRDVRADLVGVLVALHTNAEVLTSTFSAS